jgi:hypothetical protein
VSLKKAAQDGLAPDGSYSLWDYVSALHHIYPNIVFVGTCDLIGSAVALVTSESIAPTHLAEATQYRPKDMMG